MLNVTYIFVHPSDILCIFYCYHDRLHSSEIIHFFSVIYFWLILFNSYLKMYAPRTLAAVSVAVVSLYITKIIFPVPVLPIVINYSVYILEWVPYFLDLNTPDRSTNTRFALHSPSA